jgi:SP family myo-inositol transporter-like MFS transporter 13
MLSRFGRRPVIIISDIMFVAGSALMSMADSVLALIVGRCVVGIGLGLASSTVPVYISECAPRAFRGRLLTVFGVITVTGQAIAYLTAYFLYQVDPVEGWRWMLGLGAAPAILQLCLFYCLPESPRWLVAQGPATADRALAVLRHLRGAETDVGPELREIALSVEESNRETRGLGESVAVKLKTIPVASQSFSVRSFAGAWAVLRRMLTEPDVKAALTTGVMLQVTNKLC